MIILINGDDQLVAGKITITSWKVQHHSLI